MSAVSQAEFKCQKCGKDIVAIVKNSANFMDNIEEVLNGDVMMHTCETCGMTYFIDRPFLFSDISTAKFIWYVPKEIKDTSVFYAPEVETVLIRDYKEFAEEIAKLKV